VADGTTRSGSVGRATLAWQEYGLCIDSPLSAVTAARAVGGQCAFRGIAWLATSDVTQRDGLQDETSFPERRAAAKQGASYPAAATASPDGGSGIRRSYGKGTGITSMTRPNSLTFLGLHTPYRLNNSKLTG
jgi:hypothetical protein